MPMGDYSQAKVDYLKAGARQKDPETGEVRGFMVNRRGCRPLHPHGMRMVRDGLFTLGRTQTLGPRCSYTTMIITPEGEAELARLEKRLGKLRRKHAQAPFKAARSSPRPSWVKPANQTRAIAGRAEANARRRALGQPIFA